VKNSNLPDDGLKPAPAIERISQGLNILVERLLLTIGSAICLILFAQVVCRYAGASLGWSEEVSRHLLVAIAFLGGTAAYRRAGLIGMKGVGSHFGPGVARTILLILQGLSLFTFLLLCWFGTAYTFKAWKHTTAALQLPMAIPFAVIPLAMAIFAVHVAADMYRTGCGPRTGKR
jgi:TRAP-type C4-dicarboxylate transport system permease small subunit